MRRLTRTAIGAVLTIGLVAAAATPGAAAVPGPRREQWWFGAWAVHNKVWPIAQGKGVTVGVIDSGVEASIPDLSGVVLPGTDFDTGGDGRTDNDTATPPGHGTGMASLIASQGTGTGFVGVAPQVKILPIASRNLSGKAPGIRYAVDHGAKVINISQGAPTQCPSELQEAVSYAIRHDIVVVASAGNEGNTTNAQSTPANCAGVLAVGGVNAQLGVLPNTQRQPYVAVAGPATGVGSVLKDGRFYQSEGGTSSAAALTSGAIALVRSKFPDMPAREVMQRIIASTRDAGPKGRDNQTGYGAVRPYQALTMDVPKNAPNPVFAAYDKWAAANGKAAAPQGSGGQNDQESVTNWGPLVSLGIGAIVALLAVLFVLMRSRNKRPASVGPMPGYHGQGPPQPPYGRPQGPPPGFGGPPGPPPTQQGVPPRGGRPNVQPPQQPGSKVWPPSDGPRE